MHRWNLRGYTLVAVMAMGFSGLSMMGATTASASTPGTYVALGDSYSSGEANPPFDHGTANILDECDRSSQSWPRLVGVGSSGGGMTASDHVACAGAVVDDLLSVGQYPVGPDSTPQVTRLAQINKRTPVGLVTVTIGGNDAGFGPVLASCVLITCLQHPERQEKTIDGVVDRIRREVIPAIRRAAPRARAVVVGYPRIFPRNYSDLAACSWWLKPDELVHLNQIQDYLDRRLRSAAIAGGARFISVADALKGHELCTRDSWVAPVVQVQFKPSIGFLSLRQNGHPLPRGQQAIAAIVGTLAGTPLKPPPAAREAPTS
ncbi:putative Lipase 1 [Frankia sp. AiPs1]|uniref:SGNH/GDSL hydrolase family protein n=1 Tax=Frankia sp. AiPa1 TaxID=573492 RepID=UPI00202B794C|nr:SGNH/GDSL hydrolase family protein [Frankia sp. AiPa1]MCL9758164.1 SGNH/GDSL hydrolase family protein [Frankia sp. AiPa1]